MGALYDSAARERAATTTDRNLVVTAGAGTGKTTLLVDRLMHLLVRQPDPLAIGEIVALTFTNKAANEMKLRLRERLTALLELRRDTPPAGAARRREWERVLALSQRYGMSKDRLDELAAKAHGELEKSQIGTIHSFAAHLLRLYPIQSGVDPAFHEDECEEFKDFFNQEWALWLDGQLGPAGREHDIWRAALRSVMLEEVQELAAGLTGELIPLAASLAQVEGEALPLRILEWMHGLAQQANALREAHPKTNTLERMLDAAIGRLESMAQDGAGERRREGEDLPDRDVPGMTAAWSKEEYAQAKHLIRVTKALGGVEVGALAPLFRLLVPFAHGCRRRFVQRGAISFDGLLARARDLLRDYPAIRRELKGQFKAILVDEFQDTDPVQYEMILYLAEAAGHEESDWRTVRLEPGKLFIVGDPKQSIYAFRRADMEAYDAVVEDCVLAQARPGERQTLRTNFRSHARLLSPLNELFARLFPRQPIKGQQPQHEPLLAVETEIGPLPGEQVEIRLVRPEEPDADADAASRAEAEELARWLREEVFDREEILEQDVPVKIRPKHVAILLRKLTKARDYLEALRRYDIPCLTEGEKHFYERQEVIDAINLLRAVTNPHDGVALVAVLRSSFGGIPDAGIATLARQSWLDYRRDPDGRVTPDGQARSAATAVAPVYALLRALDREIPHLPLTDVMDAMLARVPLMELAAASQDGEQAVANLVKLREIVAELARRPDLTLQRLIAELTSRVMNPPDETESPLAEEGPEERDQQGAVRVLSIHKAKGLEFPVVILAGLHQKPGAGESRVLVQHDWSTGIVGVRAGDLQTVGGVYVSAKLAERQRAEQLRVLYVAMTRAKRRLILSAGLPKSRGGESFLALVGQGLGLDLFAVDRSTEVRLGDAEIPIQVVQGREGAPRPSRAQVWQEAEEDFSGLQARWEQRSGRWQAARQAMLFVSPTVLKRSEERVGREPAAGRVPSVPTYPEDAAILAGTLAHRILERWDFAADPGLLEERIGWICRTGIPRDRSLTVDVEQVSAELREMFRVFVASEPYAALRRATILGREVPFAIPWGAEGQGTRGAPTLSLPHEPRTFTPCIMEGAIDLLYRLDGQIWIADYKTDRVGDEELAARAAQYHLQARIYREAVSRTLGLEQVGFQFLFLRNGKAVVV